MNGEIMSASLPWRPYEPEVPEHESQDGQNGRCAEYLLDIVSSRPGILAAEFDTANGHLHLQYDPTVLPAPEADELIAGLGEKLGHHYNICTVKLAGGGCQACAAALQQGLRQRNQVLANVSVLPGRVALETAAPPVLRAEVTQELWPKEARGDRRLAAGLRRLRFWEGWEQTQWEVLLAALTALSIAVAWIGGALGLSQGWQVAAYGLAYVAGGYFGLRGGLAELRQRAINVDLLMMLAAVGAATIGDWREGAILLFLFSLSNALQGYAMGRSRRAIQALMKLRPEEALVRRGDTEVLLRVERLQRGDVVIVKPGERIPVDGRVVTGRSTVDQSTITGESMPVQVAAGSEVFAGTVNQAGAIEVEVSRLAHESTLARIIELVENAQEEKAPTQRFLEEFEQRYALGVIVATLLAVAIPLLAGRAFAPTFYRAMTLLVVASPCALVISTPASILSAIANAARRGILFKGGAHLETLAGVKAIAFDKTGTLTAGKPVVTDLVALPGHSEEEVLALAAAVEARSEHPLALAIVAHARRRGLNFEPCLHFEAISGRGARGRMADGRTFLIGNQELLQGRTELPVAVVEHLRALEQAGKTAMLLGEERQAGVDLYGMIAVADEPRREARETLDALRRLGIEHVIMLTGDNERVARSIAAQVGVDEFRAGLLPEDKARVVKELQARYGAVAMVGDGVNDAPALASASLGIAMGAAGTDVALETADVVLMSDDLSKLPYVVALSRRARRVIWQNIAFALGVIVVLVLSNFLVGVPLPLGVVGHEGSTLVVVANGLRLLRGKWA